MTLRPSSLTLLAGSAGLLSVVLACSARDDPFRGPTTGGSSGAEAQAGVGGSTGGTGGTAGTQAVVGGTAGTPQGGTAGTQASPTGGAAGTTMAGTGGNGAGTAGTDASGGQSGGSPGGAGGTGGDAGRSGFAGMSGSAGASGSAGSGAIPTEHFSFFVTSLARMKDLASAFGRGELGFGGDLRYGETTGLAGADKICRTIAGLSMPGAENKTWRAFLSTVHGGDNDGPIHAIDRIGEGPWYDRLGRIVAMNKQALLNTRPEGADPLIVDDLPNEDGVPNHTVGAPGCTGNDCPDNHDTLTGTGEDGHLHSTNDWSTCFDWTNGSSDQPQGMSGDVGGAGPWCGHSWPRMGSGENWMSALAEGGCAPGINLAHGGGPQPGQYDVGTGGGYGGIYCFALQP